METILAFDVGGTFIKYAFIRTDGTILSQSKVPTPLTTQKDFFDVLMNVREQWIGHLDGITLSMPGTIDAQSGFVFKGGTLRFNAGTNVKTLLEEQFHVPVELENDAHCAALAELWQGNLQGIENGMVLTFGTGIGGCLVLNGKPYKGTHLFAGEVSVLLTKDLKTYGCEALWGPQGSPTKLFKRICDKKQMELVEGPVIFEWIKEQDPVTVLMFQTYCEDIARQLLNFQFLFDPQRICIGGGVSNNPMFVEAIILALDELYEIFPVQLPKLEIVPCKFHNDSNLLGALYHFKQSQNL